MLLGVESAMPRPKFPLPLSSCDMGQTAMKINLHCYLIDIREQFGKKAHEIVYSKSCDYCAALPR